MKRYDVTINGVETTLLLSDEDAKARGLTPTETKSKAPAHKAKEPQNKSRTTADKRKEAADKSFQAKRKADG
ncbi:hypothetical protein ACEWX3_07625 [Mycobacterium sp. G7A2]|uniref:hypothetical protein n=1 Tax=Mycobacterium sp. G7A2 TaxID=3317307 RepID=UPI0035A893CB